MFASLCQLLLTRLLSHRSHPAHRLQHREQRPQLRPRGRLHAHLHAQPDADPRTGVRHRPRAFAFVPMPADMHLCPLTVPPPPPPAQYRGQPHRSRGRLRARCHPQKNYDLQPPVRRRPVVFALVSAPIDTCSSLPCGSLYGNELCGCSPNWSAEGITKLCEALKGSAVTSLECAPAPVLDAHSHMPDLSPSPPCLQFEGQQAHQHWQRHVRPAQARGNPSIDQDREPRVRRRLKVFAFVSAPIDTLLPVAAWPRTSSVASTIAAAAPTPPRASPRCARR